MTGEERTELQRLCEVIRLTQIDSKAAINEMSTRLADHIVAGGGRADALAEQITALQMTLPTLIETTIERVLKEKRDMADLAQFRALKHWAIATFGIVATAGALGLLKMVMG